MNYYRRYCGDYLKKTATLSLAEHGAYTLLLDHYYSTEEPLPAAPEALYRITRAMSKADRAATDAVVKRFWHAGPAGYSNARADEERERAAAAIKAASKNGKKGGRPKMFQPDVPHGTLAETKAKNNPVDFPAQSELIPGGKANDNPVGDNHQPPAFNQKLPTASGVPPADPPAATIPAPDPIFGYGLDLLKRKGVAERAARSFLGLMRKQVGDVEAFSMLRRAEAEDVCDPIPWLTKAMLPGKKFDTAAWAAKDDRAQH